MLPATLSNGDCLFLMNNYITATHRTNDMLIAAAVQCYIALRVTAGRDTYLCIKCATATARVLALALALALAGLPLCTPVTQSMFLLAALALPHLGLPHDLYAQDMYRCRIMNHGNVP